MPTDYKKIAEENIKKYGTDIGRYGPVLLAHLYSDRTHFIYEILQNAEDAGARAKKSVKISFHLFKDRLEIRHNGKLFDEPDVRGICGLVEGTKKDDLTQIGKFGIGFKSVYAYTNTPKIYSGDETFCIENYVQPHAIEKAIDIKDDETLFIFPLNYSEVLPEEAFNEVSKRLREIGSRTLLFLNHIEEIIWHIDGQESGNYIRDIRLGTNHSHKKVFVISNVGEQTVDEEWLIFEKPLPLNTTNDPNLKVEVAFKIDKGKNDKEIIVPVKDSKLIVFFPTEKPTYLNFLIQGPYRTTPTRENIPSEDKQNKIIIKETAELVAQSVSVVKELGYLDINFLNVLPIESKHCESEPIYYHIFQKVKEKFLADEELLPTHNGRFAKAEDVLLARGPLTEIFDNDDIRFLFSKKYWLNTGITEARTRELRDYLKMELQVKEVEYPDFAKMVTADFFTRKNDEWMISFYKSLLDQPSLWEEKTHSRKGGVLRTKPIIRLGNDSHIAPFDEAGDIQVYLPTGYKSEYMTVKKVFIENEGGLDFLKKLGLRQPDLYDEIIKFTLPKYKERKPDEEEYFNDFGKVLTFFNETDSKTKKGDLISKLADTPFILSNKDEFRRPKDIYLNAPELKQYFEGFDSASFASEKLHDRFEEKDVIDFLKKMGVADSPKRIPMQGNLSDKKKEQLRGTTEYISDNHQKDYDYEGLSLILKRITPDKSVLLWSLLLRSIEAFSIYDAGGFFQGEYKWSGHFGREHKAVFESLFLNQLRKTQWLIGKEGDLKSPSEITFSELPDRYSKEAPNIEVLRNQLCFKLDVFDQLPEDAQRILKITKNRSPKEIEEALASFDKEKESETKDKSDVWTPECEPAGVDINIEDISPVPTEPPQLEGQTKPLAEEELKRGGTPKEKKELPLIDKKAIGKWGEEYVFNTLIKRFEGNGVIEDTDFGFRVDNEKGELIEVCWLNMKSEKGVGYDFVIKMNNEEKEYIEVKSKLEEKPELVDITEMQFEFAKKLNNEGKGDKYWIYVVVNTGKSEAKIKRFNNPVKLWKDGKLRAHPVHFWL